MMASESESEEGTAFDLDNVFLEPEGYLPLPKPPTFAEHRLQSGEKLNIRLGNLVWNAARVVSEYLEDKAQEWVEGKDILELGAGAGLPSMVCAISRARTVVVTDYPDSSLVENMRINASNCEHLISQKPSPLHVEGYSWGASTETICSYLETPSAGFDVLILADVIYNHPQHHNLILSVKKTLKNSPESVAFVVFTPYQPWLLDKIVAFFPLAEENGFKVTKLFEKVMDKLLFEDDPGLIVLTGYPCSGLTYRAQQLATFLDDLQSTSLPASSKSRYKIHIVTSHDKAHPRTVYDTARSEKQARAVVYGRVKRLLGRDSIVIIDGMNYIKGWRYQLWCESKEARTTACVVHVGTPIDQCVAINEARLKRQAVEKQAEAHISSQGAAQQDLSQCNTDNAENSNQAPTIPTRKQEEDKEEPYPPELLTNLIYRYEEPSTSSRWDKPLFTVPWSDPTPPVEDIWFAITGQQIQKDEQQPSAISELLLSPRPESSTANDSGKTDTPSTSAKPTFQKPTSLRPKIIPHQATVAPAPTDPSALYAIEKLTSDIISVLRAFSLENRSSGLTSTLLTDPSNPGISIPIPSTDTAVFIPSSTLAASPTEDLAGAGGVLALPRLQRLRRQWVGMNRAYAGQRGGLGKTKLKQDELGEAFVRFLNAEFESTNEF
ncbi:hypothetical protein FQN57_007310 [Myotisia sp. PD_48]|nr:hypothetical protein FQN57_007310 [Myotisia sp. PD_48]